MGSPEGKDSIAIVLIPGAWSDESIYDALKAELQSRGHAAYSLTLSGLKDEKDPGKVGLRTHVRDVTSFAACLSAHNIVLVGHSYSGFVATLAANEMPAAISALVFIEAFLPRDGQSLLEAAALNVEEETNSIVRQGGIWPPPTRAELESQPSLSAEEIDYLTETLKGHPGRTVMDRAAIGESFIKDLPAIFIGRECSDEVRSNPVFGSIALATLDGGHWPMLTRPKELAQIMSAFFEKVIGR